MTSRRCDRPAYSNEMQFPLATITESFSPEDTHDKLRQLDSRAKVTQRQNALLDDDDGGEEMPTISPPGTCSAGAEPG